MLSSDLAAYLSPFSMLINKNALSPLYRSLELSMDTIRGCAGYGMLEITGEFCLPEKTIFVEAASFIAVINSLPGDKEVEFNLESDGVLTWECGAAKGKLALLVIKEMPRIEPLNETAKEGGWKPTAEFVQALKLGMLSCGNESLASIGMYGIVIDTQEDICVYSSDNITVSCAFVSDAAVQAPPIMTFSPDAIRLLTTILAPDEESAFIVFSEQGIYYEDGYIRASVKQLAPIKADITSILAAYSGGETTADLPVERIQAFIKRINALAESKKSTYITLQASSGKLSMSFSDGLAATEEYYLVDNLEVPDLPPIKLDALKLGRALAHTTSIILDHIDRKVLVLQGDDPVFQYIISGQA